LQLATISSMAASLGRELIILSNVPYDNFGVRPVVPVDTLEKVNRGRP
jgi:hypothetical protein